MAILIEYNVREMIGAQINHFQQLSLENSIDGAISTQLVFVFHFNFMCVWQ